MHGRTRLITMHDIRCRLVDVFSVNDLCRAYIRSSEDGSRRLIVNWVTKTIRRIARKRALEPWETKIENFEVTPQAIWPIAKSLTKRGEPKATTAIHASLGPVFYPNEKANVFANY
jgi:hypothetical protein